METEIKALSCAAFLKAPNPQLFPKRSILSFSGNFSLNL